MNKVKQKIQISVLLQLFLSFLFIACAPMAGLNDGVSRPASINLQGSQIIRVFDQNGAPLERTLRNNKLTLPPGIYTIWIRLPEKLGVDVNGQMRPLCPSENKENGRDWTLKAELQPGHAYGLDVKLAITALIPGGRAGMAYCIEGWASGVVLKDVKTDWESEPAVTGHIKPKLIVVKTSAERNQTSKGPVDFLYRLDSINSVLSLSSSKSLAAFSTEKDNAIHLLDPQNGKITRKIFPRLSNPRILAVDPGNFHLAAVDSGGENVFLYDVADSARSVVIQVKTRAKSAAFVPYSDRIAIGDTMGVVRIFDVQSGRQLDTLATDKLMDTMLKDSAQSITKLEVSKSGKYLAALGGGLIMVNKLGQDTSFHVFLENFDQKGHTINSFQISPDEQYLLAVGSNFNVSVSFGEGKTNIKVNNASAGLYLWGLEGKENKRVTVDGAIFENVFWVDGGRTIAFVLNDYSQGISGFSKYVMKIPETEIGKLAEHFNYYLDEKISLGNGPYRSSVTYCDAKGVFLYEFEEGIYAIQLGAGESLQETYTNMPSPSEEGFPNNGNLPPETKIKPANFTAKTDNFPSGSNEVRVRNPNDFSVMVTLEMLGNKKSFSVDSGSVTSVRVPDGKYEIFFEYSNDPGSMYQGDGFNLNDNGIEIQIVKVINGNYGIRKVR